MAGHREISEACLKEERNQIKRNIISEKISCEGEDQEEDIGNDSFYSNVKRYTRYDLLPLRNAHLSILYPLCALRPELQSLSIWTCRLRSELQYLGLWKITNTGNSYGNCNCNGSCQSYASNGQPYPSSNSEVTAVNSQMCITSQQLPPVQTSSSPTLGTKKAVRSRERFLNYQRCINTELIMATLPSGGGSEVSIQHHLNHQIKPAFIDHRSISSSHLMPAFAKRRMGHPNGFHGQSDACLKFNSNGGYNTEHLSNDDGTAENSTRLETSIKSGRDSVKAANNQTSANNRLDKSDLLADNQYGWINLVKKTNSDFSPSNYKINTGGGNKKLIYERRIGSGRLVPREVNWDMRAGNNKQVEKEDLNILNNNGDKDKDILAIEVDKLNSCNSSNGRYSDHRTQERRNFDRRTSNSEDLNNGASSSTNKRHYITSLAEERNNFDSNYRHQIPHFTAQRSMSFRRREYVELKDHHKGFRKSKDSREGRENRDQRDQLHHNIHQDHKEEPEWYSEGPTSQHDTIELRGFEEADDSQQQQQQSISFKYSKIERKSSESSLLCYKSSSNVNLSTKDCFDISSEVLNNSNNTMNTLEKEANNGNNYNYVNDTVTPNKELTNTNESETATQKIVPKSEEFENSSEQRSNVTELFFDNFLNIEALENTLVDSGNNQSLPANNDSGGTSRFSRWFFNTSNDGINTNNEFNNNLPNKEEAKPLNKGTLIARCCPRCITSTAQNLNFLKHRLQKWTTVDRYMRFLKA